MDMDGLYANVGIAKCPEYTVECARGALTEAIDAAGGLDWVKVGMKIAIKPNLVTFRHPEAAATTHPRLVGELCRMLADRGAKVIIGDSPGGVYSNAILSAVYSASGMNTLENESVTLNRNTDTLDADFPDAKCAKSFPYTAYLDEADAIINFSKLKTHGMMGFSGAVQNMFGTVPGTRKPEFHYRYPNVCDFANVLVDLNEFFKPTLCIMDAVWGMEGNGPTAGEPRHIGCVLASKSPYCLDIAAASIIGLTTDDIMTLSVANERGLAPKSADELDIIGSGADIRVAEYRTIPPQKLDFSDKFLALNGFVRSCLTPNPVLTKAECVGCGECAKMCPAHAIKLKDKKPKIDRSQCIHCFCCQEFCPKGALKVKRPLISRLLTK